MMPYKANKAVVKKSTPASDKMCTCTHEISTFKSNKHIAIRISEHFRNIKNINSFKFKLNFSAALRSLIAVNGGPHGSIQFLVSEIWNLSFGRAQIIFSLTV